MRSHIVLQIYFLPSCEVQRCMLDSFKINGSNFNTCTVIVHYVF